MLGGWKAGDDFRTNLVRANKYHIRLELFFGLLT